jgi:hypothetical protein
MDTLLWLPSFSDTNLVSRPSPSHVTSTLRASACIFLWLRLLCVLFVSAVFGPYVLTITIMMKDVLKFVVVLIIIILAFASAFFVLYEPAPIYRHAPTNGWPAFLVSSPEC